MMITYVVWKTGTIALVLLGLTTKRQAVWQTKNIKIKNLKIDHGLITATKVGKQGIIFWRDIFKS